MNLIHYNINLREKSASSFLQYVENNYVGTNSKKPRFSLDLWNLHERVKRDLPRTNNNVESWHSRIKPDARKNLTVAKEIILVTNGKMVKFTINFKPRY
ncbi:MULE transposase domain [Brachionus plicatilis]|uniref:MULE transposase domain n=1 Tax=Brachionus plicatilis TaxID=10195 RepID=A0A3M7RXM4_BRAPC|nr:MULE transposase domain [Brachionus plicatilis]